MRLLLDTHAAIWWLSADARLSERAVDELVDDSNEVLLSSAVVWEVAIKRSLGQLKTPGDVRELLAVDVTPLAMSIEHAEATEELPWHHRDPFDRMLVAQAKVEKASIVSRDERLRPYGVTRVW